MSGSLRLLLVVAVLLGFAPAAAMAAGAPAITVTAKPMPEGTVELAWTSSPAEGITGYEVHRSASTRDFEPSPATRLHRLPAVTFVLDNTAVPGTSPWYRIIALGSDGRALATSAPVQAAVPASPVDRQRTSVLSAFPVEDGLRLSWRAAAGAATPLTVYAGPAHVAEGKLAGSRKAAVSDTTASALTFKPGGNWAKGFALVDAEGKVLATAVSARSEHPRLVGPAELEKVRRIIEKPGLPKDSWLAIVDTLAKGTLTGSELGRVAAFAYAVTGEASYAEQAFTGFRQGAQILTTQTGALEFSGNAMRLAHTYDLAYGGWTPAQRTEAVETFKRASAMLGTTHHGNIDNDADKASNWVTIVRGGELIMNLAVRGDGDFGLQEERIPVLVDENRRHIDAAYGDSGWNQEGWDYINYSIDTTAPAVQATQRAGINALTAAWERPTIAELALHTQSLRPTGDKVQFGVGERTGGLSPHLLSTGSRSAQSAFRWMYEQTSGPSANPFTLLNWPERIPAKDPDAFPELRRALFDDRSGSYLFRNRTQGDDDVLVGVNNRNEHHFGWSQPESFALSLIGQGTTWARQPAKENTTYGLFSKPLIDGRAIPAGVTPGNGTTKESRPYPGQGGGFVSLDAAEDYGIDIATREVVTDLRPTGGADAVIALHDRFADDAPHRIDWQLSPEPGVRISYGEDEAGATTFLFQREDAWLKGWLLHPEGAAMGTSNGAFRITRTGPSAEFQVVLAVGRGRIPTATGTGAGTGTGTATATATADGSTLTLGKASYTTSDLASFTPDGPAPTGNSERPTIHLSQPKAPFTPGDTRSVTAQYTWWADRPAGQVELALDVPEGWTAERTSSPAPATLHTGQRAVVTFDVTAPTGVAAFGDTKLAATGSASRTTPISDSAPASLIRPNLALGRPAEQSSTQGAAERANDGNVDGIWGHGSVSHTLQEQQPWWQVDLGNTQELGSVTVWNRVDCCAERLHDFYVLVSDQPFGRASLPELLSRGDVWSHKRAGVAGRTTTIPVGAAGRYVRIQIDDAAPSYLILAEVQISPAETRHLAQGQPATQSTTADGGAAAQAVDGATEGAASATAIEVQPWWQTDLGESVALGRLELWTGADAGQPGEYYVLVSDVPFASGRLGDVLAQPGVTAYKQTGAAARPTTINVGKGARYVRIQLASTAPASLSLTEVRVLR
ncbi:discoidin domain-containing protein [Streptomyces sp. NPDC007861]|uniref:galactose-binding domain-containing protein n=1 Tax=Streptomyces sp. NPDC007861 TaxID=3154893 RepID=UPI0033F4142F